MDVPEKNENAFWVQPKLVCTVKYMMKTESGSIVEGIMIKENTHSKPRF